VKQPCFGGHMASAFGALVGDHVVRAGFTNG
jgi:hypothetical protein